MSKKVLTVEERVKRAVNEIMVIGILYMLCSIITIVTQFQLVFSNLLVATIFIGELAFLAIMTIGVAKRTKLGAIAAWVFELILIGSAIANRDIGIVELFVVIDLPVVTIRYMKALKEMNQN